VSARPARRALVLLLILAPAANKSLAKVLARAK
jgi:hypothetical protein